MAKSGSQNEKPDANDSRKNPSEKKKRDGAARVRLEIICSQAVEEDFDNEFKKAGIAKRYTKISPVMGAGYSTPRLGNEVWPELNIMYLIYCSKEESKTIYDIVVKLRKLYITEGIACFIGKGREL